MKARKKAIHGRGDGALTPMLPVGNDELERQGTLAILESRLNGQQRRINDNEKFIAVLKKEAKALRTLVDDLRGLYLASITLKPSPLSRLEKPCPTPSNQ